jgi:hypothetical protein
MLKRAILILPVALLLMILSSTISLAQTSSGNTDSESILNLTGLRFTKIFSMYGTPTDVYALRGETADDDGVMLDYDGFSFKVRNKVIVMALFWKDYTGAVKGLHIGDSKSYVIGKLGKTDNVHDLSDGRTTYYWELSDYYFGVIFDSSDEAVTFKTESK